MTYFQRSFYCIMALAITLIFIHYSDLDIKFQSLFFNFETKLWLIDKNDQLIKFIFYRFPKYCIVTYGVILIFWGSKLWLFKEREDLQKKILFLILALILIPLIVAILKHYSPIVCPVHIEEFGGWQKHVSPLNMFKPEVLFGNGGKCFPAGHASGGFSMIALYFVMQSRRAKLIALIGSLSLGSIMGAYQIAKGVHYLSDTITTLAIAYLVCIALEKLLLKEKSIQ